MTTATFVLILILHATAGVQGVSASAVSQEFTSQEKCLVAARNLVAQVGSHRVAAYGCYPK